MLCPLSYRGLAKGRWGKKSKSEEESKKRGRRIELPSFAWKAKVLPLN